MKRKKIKIITITTIAVLIITVLLSFQIEARSQKLPAVVRSDKVFVSTEVSGTVQQYFVSSMQEVKAGDKIVELVNSRLHIKLQALNQEREKYVELISSSQKGDHLKLELFELEENILKNTTELKEIELDLQSITEKLIVVRSSYSSSRKQYDAQQKLFAKNLISAEEYESETNDYLEILADYNELQNDSLLASKERDVVASIISLQQAEKNILNNNDSILASKHLIDLDKVNAEIFDLEQDIDNLTIISPINGIITDIRNRPGEKVKSGDVIAEINDLNRIWIIAYGNSYSSQKIKTGNSVTVYCGNGCKIPGKVSAVSPVMEKVKALSTSFETVNTYAKIEIAFDDQQLAQQNVTPGERLFVRISLR